MLKKNMTARFEEIAKVNEVKLRKEAVEEEEIRKKQELEKEAEREREMEREMEREIDWEIEPEIEPEIERDIKVGS